MMPGNGRCVPPPLSPCVRICKMDGPSGFCIGCRRTLAEIAAWFTLRDDQKRVVLADLPNRVLPSPSDSG